MVARVLTNIEDKALHAQVGRRGAGVDRRVPGAGGLMTRENRESSLTAPDHW